MPVYLGQDTNRVLQSVLAEGLRVSITNWRPTDGDLEIAGAALLEPVADPGS
jgi:hypothetical protein